MVLCEDGECSVCFFPYSRMDRIPRVLHCRHTFCQSCLEKMSQTSSGLLTVGCPLCRRVTCIGRGLSLQEVLWVNSQLWQQIAEVTWAEEEGGLRQKFQEERMESIKETECASSRLARTKLKLPGFFRSFSLTKQTQERIVPGSNVEMKSWRRLPNEVSLDM